MLINFFINIFPYKIKPKVKDDEPSSLLYQQLHDLQVKNDLVDINDFTYRRSKREMVYDCLKKAISYNDLPVIRKLYPYMLDNIPELRVDFWGDTTFNFAHIAMNYNKMDIFDFFIQTCKEKYPRISYSHVVCPSSLKDVLNSIIEDKKIHYFKILKEYSLINGHDLLESIVKDSKNKFNNNHTIDFIINNLSIGKHETSGYVSNPSTIDLDKLLDSAFDAKKLNKEVIQSLINYGADIHIDNGYLLNKACQGNDLEIIKVLLDNGIKENPNFNNIVTGVCNRSYDIEIVKCLLENGAVVNHENIHNEQIHPWVKKWNESQGLFNELSNEMNISQAPFKIKRNKL